MEKVIPLFQYEPLVLIPKSETLDEEEEKGQINGVGPSNIKTTEEEPVDLRKGRDNSQKEVGGMRYVLKQSPEPLKSVPQEVSSQEYGSIIIEIGEQI